MKAAGPRLVAYVRPFLDFVCDARLQLDRGEGELSSMGSEALLARIDGQIEELRSRRAATREVHELLNEQDRLLEDLRTFATSILARGHVDASRSINLARQRRDPLQDAAFMDHLREELKLRKPRNFERLVVYAVCLGLGYTGEEDDARAIKRLRTEIWSQIEPIVRPPRQAHPRAAGCKPLFHEAYDARMERLDRPSVPWWTIYVACTAAVAAVVVAVVQVRSVGREVEDAVKRIERSAAGTAREVGLMRPEDR